MNKLLYSSLIVTIGLTACNAKVHDSDNTNANLIDGIQLVDAYIPYRSDEQRNFAAYFELQNNTNNKLTLINAYSPAFGTVMLHESVVEDGMAKMKHIESLAIAPHESISFRPNGKHVMLMMPQRDFSGMDGIYLVLEFKNGQKEKYEIDFRKRQTNHN